VAGGRYALVYSVAEGAKEEGEMPTRSSANIDRSKRAPTYDARNVSSQRGWAIRVHAVRRGFSFTQNMCGANVQQ
jgi:hypothetical protein